MKKFKFSLWSRSKNDSSKRLGKSYGLKNGELVKEDLGTNAKLVQVVDIETLDGLEFEIDFNMHDGNGFMTSSLPKDTAITEAKVTVKDSPKKGCVSRSKDDIEWRAGTGTYFVNDYDPGWSNDKPKSIDEIRQVLIHVHKTAGVDISELQMLAYKSSSSGFKRTSDNHLLDKGGRHIISLVENAGDLERYKQVLFDLLTLAGFNYGAVSSTGHFLKRGIMHLAAVSPTQPTFAGIPAYDNKGLTNVREEEFAHRFGGDMLALDTRAVRDLTDSEKAQCRRVWDEERRRLQPEMNRKKRRWLAKQGKKLAKCMPDASPEQICSILEHRWSGNLVGSDVIILNGRKVPVAEILLNPDKYDGMTGPDPIEPDYRNGAQTCKVFINRPNGRPMIFSQAHGGIKYQLWPLRDRARSMDNADPQPVHLTMAEMCPKKPDHFILQK